jgi:hypothetical protein
MFKVYIYNIPNAYLNIAGCFEECTSVFTMFHESFLNQYKIVDDIQNADFAYIPFTIGSLFVSKSIEECKIKWIETYKPHIKHDLLDKIPHILIWGYVLYQIDLTFINSKIYIISLESKGESSISNIDRMLVVPYILDIQTHWCCAKLTRIDNDKLRLVYEDKQSERVYDISYVGRTFDKTRNVIIDYLENEFTIQKYIPSEMDPFEIYKKTKLALILRGDTPTRKALFHAIAAGSIPIIFESCLEEYDYMYFGMFESLRNICICIPDYDNEINYELYLINIKIIIKVALNNYQLNPEKFKDIFRRYNYYEKTDGYSNPVYHSVNAILNKNKLFSLI